MQLLEQRNDLIDEASTSVKQHSFVRVFNIETYLRIWF